MSPNETRENIAFHRTQASQQALWTSCFAKSGCHKLEHQFLPICCRWCPWSFLCEVYWKEHVKPPLIQWFRGADTSCTQPVQSMSLTDFPENPGLGKPKAGMNWATEAPKACVTVEVTPDNGMRSMRCTCGLGGDPHSDSADYIECQGWTDPVCGRSYSDAWRSVSRGNDNLRFTITLGTNGKEYNSRNGRCFPNKVSDSNVPQFSGQNGFVKPWASGVGTAMVVYVDVNFELYNADCGPLPDQPGY